VALSQLVGYIWSWLMIKWPYLSWSAMSGHGSDSGFGSGFLVQADRFGFDAGWLADYLAGYLSGCLAVCLSVSLCLSVGWSVCVCPSEANDQVALF